MIQQKTIFAWFFPQPSLMGLDFNPSMQQLGQNVLPVFDSLVFF